VFQALTKALTKGIAGLVAGIGLLIAGYQVNALYYRPFGYVGFLLMVAGCVITVLGTFKTVEGILKRVLEKELKRPKWLPPRITEISPTALFHNLQIVSYGLSSALVGSLIASTWAKFTIENYTGFGLLVVGLGVIIFGVFGIISGYIVGISHGAPISVGLKNVAYGLALFVIGSVTASLSAKYTIQNYLGFSILLVGIFVVTFGAFKVISEGAKEYINRMKLINPIKVHEKALSRSLLIVAFAIAACITGYTIADQWSMASLENYFGYGLLLVGTVTLLTGHGGLVVAFSLPRINASRAHQKIVTQLETAPELDNITDEDQIALMLQTEQKLIALLAGKDQATITSLAYEVNLSTDLTKKMIQRSIQHNTISGYLTLDGQTYLSTNGLRKNLAEALTKA
jgi:hypothetical protein